MRCGSLRAGRRRSGSFAALLKDTCSHCTAPYRNRRSRADVSGSEQRTISDDFAVRLSDTELQQMRHEFAQLLDRWTDTSRSLSDADDGVERRAYYGVVMAALVQDISATTDRSRKEHQS